MPTIILHKIEDIDFQCPVAPKLPVVQLYTWIWAAPALMLPIVPGEIWLYTSTVSIGAIIRASQTPAPKQSDK